MLILKRNIGEVIRINHEIKIVVMGYEGKHVKLGIEAPKNIPIHREEIYQRILLEINLEHDHVNQRNELT